MDILEESIKHDKETAAAVTPPYPRQPEVDIIKKPEHEERFAKMLEQGDLLRAGGLDPQELSAILTQPDLAEAGDFSKLAQAQDIYLQQLDRSRSIIETVTNDTVQEFAASSPELQDAIKLRGPEKIAEFVQKQLSEIAMSDPARFDAIRTDSDALKTYTEAQSIHLKDEFERICKERHIEVDQSKIVRVLNNPNPYLRTQELRAEINNGYRVSAE